MCAQSQIMLFCGYTISIYVQENATTAAVTTEGDHLEEVSMSTVHLVRKLFFVLLKNINSAVWLLDSSFRMEACSLALPTLYVYILLCIHSLNF